MNTTIVNDIQGLVQKAASTQGAARMEFLNHASALAASAKTPTTLSVSHLTADQESCIRTLQGAMKWPEVAENCAALMNIARTIRRIRIGSM